MIPQLVAVKEVLGQCSAKSTPTDDDDVKGPRIRSPGRAPYCFIEPVANVPAKDVFAKVSVLGGWACRHLPSPSFVATQGHRAEKRAASW